MIIELILSGRLKAKGRLGERHSMNEMLIAPEDVFETFSILPRNGFTKSELCKRWSISPRKLNSMIEQGVLSQQKMKHSLSRVTGLLIPYEDVCQFEREGLGALTLGSRA